MLIVFYTTCAVAAVGADLNRDFPSPFKAPGCKGRAPERCDPLLLSLAANSGVMPETAAIMAWTSNDSWPFTAAANLHEGAVVVSASKALSWAGLGLIHGGVTAFMLDRNLLEAATLQAPLG